MYVFRGEEGVVVVATGGSLVLLGFWGEQWSFFTAVVVSLRTEMIAVFRQAVYLPSGSITIPFSF